MLDILYSDNYPASRLVAAFCVAIMDDNDYKSARATVSGKRADLLVGGLRDQLPVIDTVWSKGQRVY